VSPRRFQPRFTVVDQGHNLCLTVVLPGMEREDVELTVADDALVLRGEKKVAAQTEEEGCYRLDASTHPPGGACMELKDYYFILGVPRTATTRDILRAYRELAKLYHPDRVGPQGTATFQDIVEAYAVLSDPERRRHYTESLSQFVDVTASAPLVGSARPEPLIPAQHRFGLYSQPEPLVPEPMSLLADFGTISPSLDALSDRLRQNFTGRATPKAVQLTSLTVEVRLSPYEARQGVLVPLGIPVFVRCAVCGGSGRDWYTLCLSCQGQGMVETAHTVQVRIPPRVREGTMVEVPLHQLGIHNVFVRVHIRITW